MSSDRDMISCALGKVAWDFFKKKTDCICLAADLFCDNMFRNLFYDHIPDSSHCYQIHIHCIVVTKIFLLVPQCFPIYQEQVLFFYVHCGNNT